MPQESFYIYNINNGNAEITAVDVSIADDIVIPNTLGGFPVTSIGSYAFCNCTGLTNVYITDIAAWCNIDFYDNYSNPFYYADNLYLNNKLLIDLVIPEGIDKIPVYAFSCKNITSVTIPYSVTSIGDYAFYECSKISDIYYGSSKSNWNKINIGSGNDFSMLTIHYVSTINGRYKFNGILRNIVSVYVVTPNGLKTINSIKNIH